MPPADSNISETKREKRMRHILMAAAPLLMLLNSCATQPYPEEAKITLQDAIVGASESLTMAEQQIKERGLKTYGFRPSKATVSFDLSTLRGTDNKAELNVAAPVSGGIGGGILGWSATRRLQKGNHIEIEFTPKNK